MLFLQSLLLISSPQFAALELLSASQVAELTLTSGALHNVGLIRLVLDRLEGGNAFQEIGEFLTALISAPQVRYSFAKVAGANPRNFLGRQRNRPRLLVWRSV